MYVCSGLVSLDVLCFKFCFFGNSKNLGSFIFHLCSGFADTLKCSFYANPILDSPTTDESLIQRYLSYCGSKIWPNSELLELEVAFKALGQLILGVGLMVAYHCDRYGIVFAAKVYTKRA
ncbi:hypothetical protein TB2_025870 [Malus domestica]